jgi:catechol 2,3-dioxygenase-like lactoylglutathione lyase family enzyme
MQPRIGTISIGVADLQRSLAFYRDRLGFPTEGIVGEEFENGAVVFIDLEGGMRLALWPLASMAADTGMPVGGAPSVTLGYMTSTRQEVDAGIALAREAGARIIKEPVDTPWGGYSGYFADPDGHLWEVVWIPEDQGWVDGRYVGDR